MKRPQGGSDKPPPRLCVHSLTKGALMRRWISELDRLLRGETTRLSNLRGNSIDVPLGGLAFLLIILGMIYGACMGAFALLRPSGPSYDQLLASTVKLPLLFILTLIVTFPSLYVFNALVGSQLRIGAVLRLLVAALAVMLAVLSSFGPIVAFFSVSTTSYPFMVLLNVLMFTVSGILGLSFLLQTLHRLSLYVALPTAEPVADPDAPPLRLPEPIRQSRGGALDPVDGYLLGPHVKTVFRCWIIVFGVVGAQMSWILRPFIGNPDQPFTWFRPRDSNFFESIVQVIRQLVW